MSHDQPLDLAVFAAPKHDGSARIRRHASKATHLDSTKKILLGFVLGNAHSSLFSFLFFPLCQSFLTCFLPTLPCGLCIDCLVAAFVSWY